MEGTLTPTPSEEAVAAVRHFNRFYTRQVGALDSSHLASPFSLTQGRILFELAHWAEARGQPPTATDIGRELGLDAGYLSRLLRGFERKGLVQRTLSRNDGRRQQLRLTDMGRSAFADLDARARDDVAALLGGVEAADRRRVLAAMSTIERVLDPASTARDAPSGLSGAPPFILRPPESGDFGWVIARHGVLYAAEYGWDARMEALIARIVADFIEQNDPKQDRCWIAEREGENIGSIFLVRHPDRPGVARLRLLLVEPAARGLGLGRRLVDECTRFARQAGYHTITLWTNSVLTSARRIYEAAGYQLVEESPHHSFGVDLVGQTWELALSGELGSRTIPQRVADLPT